MGKAGLFVRHAAFRAVPLLVRYDVEVDLLGVQALLVSDCTGELQRIEIRQAVHFNGRKIREYIPYQV